MSLNPNRSSSLLKKNLYKKTTLKFTTDVKEQRDETNKKTK